MNLLPNISQIICHFKQMLLLYMGHTGRLIGRGFISEINLLRIRLKIFRKMGKNKNLAFDISYPTLEGNSFSALRQNRSSCFYDFYKLFSQRI